MTGSEESASYSAKYRRNIPRPSYQLLICAHPHVSCDAMLIHSIGFGRTAELQWCESYVYSHVHTGCGAIPTPKINELPHHRFALLVTIPPPFFPPSLLFSHGFARCANEPQAHPNCFKYLLTLRPQNFLEPSLGVLPLRRYNKYTRNDSLPPYLCRSEHLP